MKTEHNITKQKRNHIYNDICEACTTLRDKSICIQLKHMCAACNIVFCCHAFSNSLAILFLHRFMSHIAHLTSNVAHRSHVVLLTLLQHVSIRLMFCLYTCHLLASPPPPHTFCYVACKDSQQLHLCPSAGFSMHSASLKCLVRCKYIWKHTRNWTWSSGCSVCAGLWTSRVISSFPCSRRKQEWNLATVCS